MYYTLHLSHETSPGCIATVTDTLFFLTGIPVYQQQLVHGDTELHDEFCLEEYCIGSGAQLKLLLAMRGGPIHAHRGEG